VKIVRSVVFVGETHVGSRYSIFPRGFKVDGKVVPLNTAQKKLLSYWDDFWEKVDAARVDTIVVTGEYIDGQNVKEYGKDMVVHDLNLQAQAAIALWKPKIGNRKLRAVTGSDYHIKAITFDIDHYITTELGGIHKGAMTNLVFAPSKLVFNVSHDLSVAPTYKTTPLNKEIIIAREAAELQALPVSHYDVIVRGHIHDFFYIHDRSMHGLVVPCWKCYYPIRGRTRYHPRYIPVIGGVIVHLTDGDTIVVQEELYPAPHLFGALEEIDDRGN